MNDQILGDLLERSVELVPDTSPPLAEIREEARSTRTHQRGVLLAGAAAVLAVVAGVAWGTGLVEGPEPAAPTSITPPPRGMKWIGVGDTVVAVSNRWAVVPGIYCEGPPLAYVTIVKAGVAVSCAPPIPGERAATPRLTLSGAGSGSSGRLAGVNPIAPPQMHLPSGWLAIPAGAPSGGFGPPTLSSQIDTLEAAGFRVVVRKSGYVDRWRPFTTYPEIGSPAKVGSTVIVMDHGLRASSAVLHGRLAWVGGPAPGTAQPHVGTVHVVSKDGVFDQTIGTDARGRWTMHVPPGTYTVTATSPGYLSERGASDACHAEAPVIVGAHQSARTDVYCQMM